MKETEFLVYVTKNALTQGILEVKVVNANDNGMVKTLDLWAVYYHKSEYFLTREEAVVDAEERRTKKIESLSKSIKKLEALVF